MACRCLQRKRKLNNVIPGLGDAVEALIHFTGLDKLVTPMKWAYGITTTPERFDTTLPTTLASLEAGGFDMPRLFIDLKVDCEIPETLHKYPITVREQNMGVVGNWMLALWELLMREPLADRYAIFQDDFVTYRNLRQYLEQAEYPADGYLNLYTFPQNQKLAKGREGFYRSNQLGKGAVALIFDRETAVAVATSTHLVNKPKCPKRGRISVDGGILTAALQAKRFEYVHNPSLVQHIGLKSSMGNKSHPQAQSFRGEAFDALELLSKEAKAPPPPVPASTPEPSPEPAVDSSPPSENKMRLGIMGPCCDTPGSHVLWKFAQHHRGTRWFVTQQAGATPVALPPSTGEFRGRTVGDFRRFFSMIDTLIFYDEPPFALALPVANQAGVKVVRLVLGEGDEGFTGTGPQEEVDDIPPRWMHYVDETLVLREGEQALSDQDIAAKLR
jgi:hypothetical protein